MKEYAVKDIADMLGVSKSTIQRITKNLEADRTEGQKKLFGPDKVAMIAAKMDSKLDLVGTASPRQTASNDAVRTASPRQDSEIELLKDMLAVIREELATKDKQIEAYAAQIAMQNEQIKDYSERLKEAMQLTKGQQYIAAADKTERLLGASSSMESRKVAKDKKNKVSIWKRLFGKK